MKLTDKTNSTQAALDYRRVEQAIAFLQGHFQEQPDLRAAARAAHVSEYHFQRLFSRWAGISPKRFLQFLTVEHAKQQLRESRPVLEAALDSGLSSPGRLHDLFVSVEAVTPGEFKTCGAGLEVQHGFHSTPFGRCLLGTTARGVCWLSFVGERGERTALRELREHWSGAHCFAAPAATEPLVEHIFAGFHNGSDRSLSLLLMGTNFQLKVWQALLQIPAGTVVSYEVLGGRIGAPNASRAIGAAVGQNPVAYLIPCHRVIRKSGALGGYRWGLARKGAMLGWEAAQVA